MATSLICRKQVEWSRVGTSPARQMNVGEGDLVEILFTKKVENLKTSVIKMRGMEAENWKLLKWSRA